MSEDDIPTSTTATTTTSITAAPMSPAATTTNTQSPKYEKNGFLNASTGSSPPAPQALLSSSAALSPGLPIPQPYHNNTSIPLPQPPSPSPFPSPIPPREDNPIDSQVTPRARQPSSSRLIPPDHHHRNLPPSSSSSRPTSQISLTSSSSQLSSLNSPLCTPKVRDFAYPRTHKYHAPSFAGRRYSISSRSSTASDIDSLFPQRIGAGPLYLADESWKLLSHVGDDQVAGEEGEDYEVMDGEEEESVERRAVCVFDFQAECEGEISIEIGQVVWVEFRKGVSGWLVVRDEITESKGLVPEGYVRFLNEEEERQYLAQSPPSNTLLPREDQERVQFTSTTGEDTPRQVTSIVHSKESWDKPSHSAGEDIDPGGQWVDDPLPVETQGSSRDDWMDGMIAGVQKVNVQRPPA